MENNNVEKKMQEVFDIPKSEIPKYLEIIETIFQKPMTEEKIVYTEEEKRMKEDETIVKTSVVCVRCKRNDRGDIKAGGPEYLGYIFLVETEKAEEMTQFIQEKLKENGQPLLHLFHEAHAEDVPRKEMWTKTDVENDIKKSYE